MGLWPVLTDCGFMNLKLSSVKPQRPVLLASAAASCRQTLQTDAPLELLKSVCLRCQWDSYTELLEVGEV